MKVRVVFIALGVCLVAPRVLDVVHPPSVYAPEITALKVIQVLNTAQVQYNSQYGRFARSLTELGPPISGTENASAAGLLPADLAAGEKQGYHFTLMGTLAGYAVTAVPVSFGSTGSRTFYSDQTLTVHENYGQEPATVNSPEVGSAAKSDSK
jgi:hypothetical protein